MADDLVLARLSVDPSGVVSGINTSDVAFRRGEKSLNAFGTSAQTVTGKLFNMRGAMLRLAGAFGVIGLVTSLAVGLSRLVTDLITSTTWFKNLKEAVTDWWMEMVKGEDALGRMARKMKDLTGGTGITSAAESMDKLRELVKKRQELISTMGSSDPLLMKTALADVKAFNIAINESIAKLQKLGFTASEIGAMTGAAFTPGLAAPGGATGGKGGGKPAGPAPPDLFGILGIPSSEEMAKRFNDLQDAARLLQEIKASLPGDLADKGLQNLISGFQDLGLTLEQVKETLSALGFEMTEVSAAMEDMQPQLEVSTTAWDDFLASLEQATEKGAMGVGLVQTAMNQFVGSMTTALATGKFSFKKFFAEMLMAMVPVLLGYAAMLTVMGIAFGSAAHLAAAGVAFAGAAAAAAAARALGGGGGEQGARGGGGGGSVGGGGSISRNQTVTVIVHGSLLGVGGEDALARDLNRLITTAREDGSG